MGQSGKHPSGRARRRAAPRSVLAGLGLPEFYFGKNLSRALRAGLRLRWPGQDRFEMVFFEGVLRRRPDHLHALQALGHTYTRLGLVQKGLVVDERLVRLRPEHPVAHYNLACSYALLGRLDEAFAALNQAIRLGYRDFEHLGRDPDMAALRADPRYQQFLDSARSGLDSGGRNQAAG